MFSNSSAVYGTKLKSRCIVAQEADVERHRFFVASSCLREDNEIQLIEFSEEMMDSISCVRIYQHPKEVFDIVPSPRDPGLLVTSSSDGEAVLWRAPGASDSADVDDDLGNSSTPLRNVATLEDPGVNEPCRVLWKPQEGSGGAEHVGTLGRHVRIYDVAADGAPRESCSFAISEATPAFGGAWDPHHGSTVSVTHDCSASGWDMRSQKLAYSIATAHKYAARGIDYNPNKPLCVVTSGDDRLVKCWDLRNTRAPVRTLAGHSHWCWTVKYNRFHDQLLLSAGSDSIVNLWRCSSISSAPLLELDGDPNQAEADDCKVRTFTDHEESVYSAAWSACDAWVWASLDYSGRVVINHVPSTEKYKILL